MKGCHSTFFCCKPPSPLGSQTERTASHHCSPGEKTRLLRRPACSAAIPGEAPPWHLSPQGAVTARPFTHNHIPSHTHTHTITHSPSHTHTHTQSHTALHTHTHTHTITHTPSHTHTHTIITQPFTHTQSHTSLHSHTHT